MCFVLPVPGAHAAACTFTSNATGNWSAAGTWTAVGTGCSTYPGQTYSGDTVVIATGNTVTLDVSPANAIASLTVNAAATANGVALAGYTLTVTGAITMTSPTAVVNSTIAVGTGTLSCGQHCYSRQRYWRQELYSISLHRYNQCYRQYHVFGKCRSGTINVYRRRDSQYRGKLRQRRHGFRIAEAVHHRVRARELESPGVLVRHSDDGHAGRHGSLHSGRGILEYQALLRSYLQALGGMAVDVRRGLVPPDVIAGDDGVEVALRAAQLRPVSNSRPRITSICSAVLDETTACFRPRRRTSSLIFQNPGNTLNGSTRISFMNSAYRRSAISVAGASRP